MSSIYSNGSGADSDYVASVTSSPYTAPATAGVYLVNTEVLNSVINLPQISTCPGATFHFINIDNNGTTSASFNAFAGDSVGGQSTLLNNLAFYGITLFNDGANTWYAAQSFPNNLLMGGGVNGGAPNSVLFVGVAGELDESADFTYDGTTLAVGGNITTNASGSVFDIGTMNGPLWWDGTSVVFGASTTINPLTGHAHFLES